VDDTEAQDLDVELGLDADLKITICDFGSKDPWIGQLIDGRKFRRRAKKTSPSLKEEAKSSQEAQRR